MNHEIAPHRMVAWHGRNRVDLILAASAALAIGILVYAIDRRPETIYLLPAGWSLGGETERWFGSFGGQLPEFAHVYAFGLLTAAIFGDSRRLTLFACVGWWALDSLFELGQHPAISPIIASALPSWFGKVPLLENTGPFFIYGTFDPLDLAAIAVGAVVGYFTIVFCSRYEDYGHVECS